jgi:hypothetical protein
MASPPVAAAMKNLVRQGLASCGLEIRRLRPHHGVPYVEDIGLSHALEILFQRADDLTFVQVGANDGICNDLLRPFLETADPRGVLMEPQAEPFRKLQERYGDRERLVLLRAAVDQRSGSRTLYRCRDGLVVGAAATVLSGFASFDRSQVVKSYLGYARTLRRTTPSWPRESPRSPWTAFYVSRATNALIS